jgi:hypothetical protein
MPANKPAALPEPTFSPEMLSKLLNEMTEQRKFIAELMAERQILNAAASAAKPAKTQTLSVAGKSEKVIKNELECIRAFKKLGIANVVPKVNVLTFNKWLERGLRPLEGSKAVRVQNLRLWHETQVRPLTKEETKKAREQLAAYAAATAIPPSNSNNSRHHCGAERPRSLPLVGSDITSRSRARDAKFTGRSLNILCRVL